MGDYDFRGAFFVALILAGLFGWAIIEGLIWVFGHLHITIS